MRAKGAELGLRRVLFAVAFLAAAGTAASAGGDEAGFMWWRMTGSERTPDGGMTISYELCQSSPASLDDLEILYLSAERRGTSSTRAYGEPEAYRKRPESAELPLSVTIYSGRTERMELRASARSGGRVRYASTVVHCYGDSGAPDGSSERTDVPADWPGFRLAEDDNFYRAQTGSPISVRINPAPRSADVFEDGAPAAGVSPDENGVFTYIPPHDDALSSAGYSAKKDVVFVAELPDGRGRASFYMPVYRAFYGHTSLAGGLAVIAAGASSCLILVLARGRKFRWR